jgi:hypothetical protein
VKSLDNDLESLSADLERLDYVVARHGDFVCVRLPLISSVRIHHTPEGRFRFVPQVGPLKRSTSLFLTSGVALAAVGGTALEFGPTTTTLVVSFLGIIALAHEACRFVLTEGCLARIQQLISTGSAGRSALGSPQRPMIAESAQYTYLDQRAADQTPASR